MNYISYGNGSQVLSQGGFILDRKQATPMFVGKAYKHKKGELIFDSSKGTYVKSVHGDITGKKQLNNL